MNDEATLESLIPQARLLVKFPEDYGPRPFPPDMMKLPFGEIAKIIAANVTNEFSSQHPVPMTVAQWNGLTGMIERRISHMLYNLAFPAREPR